MTYDGLRPAGHNRRRAEAPLIKVARTPEVPVGPETDHPAGLHLKSWPGTCGGVTAPQRT
jgi:hypothetical protein